MAVLCTATSINVHTIIYPEKNTGIVKVRALLYIVAILKIGDHVYQTIQKFKKKQLNQYV